MDCGRTNCTVEWTSSFIKREQDQTSVGFNVSFLPATANASVAGNNDGGGYMEVRPSDLCVYFVPTWYIQSLV